MKKYSQEVKPAPIDRDAWGRNLKAASRAFKACKEINPDNPIAAAEAMLEIWRALVDALPVMESEAGRRDASMKNFGDQCTAPYWREMRELADRIDALILKATAREKT